MLEGNKPAYAAVEKPTIPPEVSDKKQASSTKSFRTRFSKNSLNSTLAKDQDPMSLLLKRPTLPMPQVSSHLSQVRTSLRLLTRELRTTWPGQLTTSLIFQTMSVLIAGAVVQLFADAHFFRMLGLPLSFSVTLYYT